MKNFHLLLLSPVLLLAACTADSKPEQSPVATESPHKKLSERMTESNGYKQDADGNWKPHVDRRSPYENKGQDPNFQKNFKKQDYKTGDYAKKSWWGNKPYEPKSYAGNTDGSRFQKSSDLQGKTAPDTSTTAKIPDPYKTGSYSTSAAHEAGAAPIKKSSNAAIDNRQKVFQQPEIIDWREQRTLSMDQSKGLLGH